MSTLCFTLRGHKPKHMGTTAAEDSKNTPCLPCRFNCLVHVNVIPKLDVAAVQNEIYTDLQIHYNDPSGLLQLLADAGSIHTRPIGRKYFSPTSVCYRVNLAEKTTSGSR